MKFKFLIIICLIISAISCKKQIKIYEKIIVTIEQIELNDGSVYIKSKVNFQNDKITEHGHCWSSEYNEPIIEISSYSCLGPLTETKEFDENLFLSVNERLYIRAFVIVDSHIVYGKTQLVQK